MRHLSRAVTALIAVALLGGPPLLAVLWILHHRAVLLDGDGVRDWLQQPQQPTDIIGAVILVTVLLWLLLIAHLTRRGLAALSRRRRRLPAIALPTPSQMTAGSMAGVAALTLPATMLEHHIDQQAATTAPPPADPAEHDRHQPATTAHTETGIDLPDGGWMPYRTAAAAAALATTTWLLRRRAYQPAARRLGTHHHDADLQPMPATVQAVTAAQAATRGPAEPVRLDQLPPGLLHLHGPGAHAAARGLIVTAALTAATHPPTAELAISSQHWNQIMPGHDAGTALGVSVVPDPALTGTLHVGGTATPAQPSTNATTLLTLDGAPPAKASWHVAVDGTTTGTGPASPSRICVLDPQAAGDLLALVRHRLHPAPSHPMSAPASPSQSRQQPRPVAPGRLTLFGECALTVDGQPVRLRRSASLQILAYLAAHPTGATRSNIIAAIWPHLPPASIVQRFHTTHSDLRRQLQPAITDPITRQGEHYRLNTDMIETDIGQWQTIVAATTSAAGQVARRDTCIRLLQLYEGDLAANQPWPWIEPLREQVRRDALDACTVLADHATATEALTWLRKALTIDAYNTSLQHRVAQMENASGAGHR